MKRASMTVYDYASTPVEIALPDKEIVEIYISVISGDETGYVEFADRSKIRFDSSNCRMMSFYDGDYCVEGENIQKWLDFKPSGDRTVSYERQEYFEEL